MEKAWKEFQVSTLKNSLDGIRERRDED